MRPFTAYLKMQLNVNYGVSALKYRFTREKKKLWEPVLIAVAIAVSLLPLLALYTFMMTGIFAAGATMNQPEIVLTISFLFAQFIILFFGIFYIMGTFYFSQDLEFLIPLPLRPFEVIGGKFVVIMINEYLTALPILLPPLIIYGAGTGQNLLYWIKALLLLLSAPVIPLSAAAVVIVVLMRFVNFRRYKDFFAIIGGFMIIVIVMGFSMITQNMPKTENPDFIKNLLASKSGLIEMIGSKFPPSIWATKGLSGTGLTGLAYLLLFLAVCTALFLLLLLLSEKLFYKALLAGQEVTRKKKKLTATQMDKQYGKASSSLKALMQREWKLLFRTPIYVLNGLSGSIVGPFIVLILFFTKNTDKDSIKVFDMISTPEAAPYIMLGGLGLMLFTAGMNVVASTSMSREGRYFWITKLIPVPANIQVMAKFLVGYIVSAAGVLMTGVILWLFLNQPLLYVLGAILVGLMGSVPMAAVNLLLDVFHPKLVWNSEQEAMKQNINSLIGMLFSMFILLVLGAAVFIMMVVSLPIWLIFIVLGFLSAILGILMIIALISVAKRKFAELEA